MTPADAGTLFAQAGTLVESRLGLRQDPSLRSRLQRCLRDEAGARGEDLAAYVARLAVDPSLEQSLYDRVTVQETAFFRQPGQFAALAGALSSAPAPVTGPVTVWSAGCSNGQEAYSIAMVLEEQGIRGRVLATDVSTRALTRTAQGCYRGNDLKGLSDARRDRFFTAGPDASWQVSPSLRSRVSVAHLNLLSDAFPDEVASCQAVFCCNVLIYFTAEHARAFLTRLAAALPDGACLFLGYAEMIGPATDLFTPVRIGDAVEYYRKASRPSLAGTKQAGGQERGKPARSAVRPGLRAPRSRPPARPPAAAPPDAAELRRMAQTAAAAGDHQRAIAAFRACTFLEPDEPIAQLQLGLVLEAAGDAGTARRAFRAARSAVERADSEILRTRLDGYRVEEVVRLLDTKLAEGRP